MRRGIRAERLARRSVDPSRGPRRGEPNEADRAGRRPSYPRIYYTHPTGVLLNACVSKSYIGLSGRFHLTHHLFSALPRGAASTAELHEGGSSWVGEGGGRLFVALALSYLVLVEHS